MLLGMDYPCENHNKDYRRLVTLEIRNYGWPNPPKISLIRKNKVFLKLNYLLDHLSRKSDTTMYGKIQLVPR